MEKNRNKRPNWIFRSAMVLLILVLVTAHLSSGMLARYRVTSTGSDGARVAVFQVKSAGEQFVQDFSVAMDPDSPDTHCAQVTIVNESETAIRCTVTVTTTGNLPLEFYCLSGGARVQYVDIPVGESTQAVLELYADWIDEKDSYLYHREMDHVTVTVTCEQID